MPPGFQISLQAGYLGSEGLRLFRDGAAPPLRGTHVEISPISSALHTQGSIEFYNTYPGMYVPPPIGLRHVRPTHSLATIASETLALTKMNWNQTRLDGKLPVTLRTAEQVKRVLRFCPPNRPSRPDTRTTCSSDCLGRRRPATRRFVRYGSDRWTQISQRPDFRNQVLAQRRSSTCLNASVPIACQVRARSYI